MTELSATIVFQKNWEALNSIDKRFIVNRGGSRSSKTFSLCQALILYALQNDNKTISIVRKTFPSLRATVMRDLFEVLNSLGIYDRARHNKTENIYKFDNGSVIEFFSIDDSQKIRGRKRDICFVNEANEIPFEAFQQLNMRTTTKMIFDFNPSENDSWLYNLPDVDKVEIHSTYKDNPFLEKEIIKQIEDLKKYDESLYQIYALGINAITKENIYSHFIKLENKPERFKDFIYSIDFGYTHPTAMLKIWYTEENEVYVEELIYESHLTSADLLEKFEALGIEKNREMIADYARPEIIQEIRNKGYYILNAEKSVQKGINAVKTTAVHTSSDNVWKEYMSYRYKKINDRITEDPTKVLDDAMDSLRYGIVHLKKGPFNRPASPGLDVFSFGR
jgi:phage terminase large subunit